MSLPRVALISLGGTIASTRITEAGAVPTLSGEDLAAAVPQLTEFAQLSIKSLRKVPGAHVTLEDIIAAGQEAIRQIDAGASGVVITQGTDTIEETAFALDILVDRQAPIVVTGAMRNPSLPGADGPANLLAAVQVAASEAAQGLGTVVVFNDEIHAGRYVRKTHTTSPATFRSPQTGPLGWVCEERVRIAMRPASRYHITGDLAEEDRPVAIVTLTVGDDGRLLPLIPQAGYAGVVIESLGAGHVPPGLVDVLAELATRMPVVLASRTGSGELLQSTYSFPGSEIDLLGRGLINAGWLDGIKARLLLTLLLRSGASHEQITSAFHHKLCQ